MRKGVLSCTGKSTLLLIILIFQHTSKANINDNKVQYSASQLKHKEKGRVKTLPLDINYTIKNAVILRRRDCCYSKTAPLLLNLFF